MKTSQKHTCKFCNIGLLLIGAVFYFINPVNNYSDCNALASCLRSNFEINTDSEIADQSREIRSDNSEIEAIIGKALSLAKVHLDDIDFPVEEHSDGNDEIHELSLKEWEDNENSSSGMNKLVFIKQANISSFLPVEEFSVDVKFLLKHKKYVLKEYSILFQNLPVFSHYLTPSPFKSGIAINAP